MQTDRYHRQVLLPQVAPQGQARLRGASILLVGCGALGGVIADQLVRAGIGTLLIADRDIVELTNLQRQVLFDEADAREGIPKAVAAAQKLAKINSQVSLDPRVTDVHGGNVEGLAGCEGDGPPVDLILDGTDNVATRYLLNDVSVKHGIPWVYGACVGVEGRCMAVVPPTGPCLQCIFPEPPAAAELPTCDTAGVLAPAAAIVASLQVTAALRVLLAGASPSHVESRSGRVTSIEPLVSVDVWAGRFRRIALEGEKRADCICCGRREFKFLEAGAAGQSTSLCGRDAVQVRPQNGIAVKLSQLADKLSQSGHVQRTPHLLRCELYQPTAIRLTIFPDGRAIVHGTADLERARSIYSRFVGD